MSLPPPLPGAVRERLRQVFERIAAFTDQVTDAWPRAVACGSGCDQCCRQVLGLRGVEAAYLLEGARAMGDAGVSLVWQSLSLPGETCPLLHGGECVAYDHRPAICRTHGFPLLRKEGESLFVHHCPRNFQEVPPDGIPPAHLLDEERLVLLLDTIDGLYCRETGWEGDRVALDDLLRRGLRP